MDLRKASDSVNHEMLLQKNLCYIAVTAKNSNTLMEMGSFPT